MFGPQWIIFSEISVVCCSCFACDCAGCFSLVGGCLPRICVLFLVVCAYCVEIWVFGKDVIVV
jgi:hypothetical protein